MPDTTKSPVGNGNGHVHNNIKSEQPDPFETLARVDAVLEQVLIDMDKHLTDSERALDKAEELAAP